MVIISTSAVEVSIQAVSPALILSVPTSCGAVRAGGAGAAASAEAAVVAAAGVSAWAHAVCAQAPRAHRASRGMSLVVNKISSVPVQLSWIAVASFSAVQMRSNLTSSVTCLGDELNRVFPTAVDLGAAARASKPSDLGDRHPGHPRATECLANVVELGRLMVAVTDFIAIRPPRCHISPAHHHSSKASAVPPRIACVNSELDIYVAPRRAWVHQFGATPARLGAECS